MVKLVLETVIQVEEVVVVDSYIQFEAHVHGKVLGREKNNKV